MHSLARRRRIAVSGIIVVVVVSLLALGWVVARQHVWHTQPAQVMPAVAHDASAARLARPDALIVTQSLRDLPRDLLQVPLLKTLLTENFVFYYRHNSRLLGIEGTLRRIAYEHHLSLRDDAVALLLDRPADVALWRGRDGSLDHWLIDTTGSAWLPWLKLAANLAGKDPAIKQIGKLPLRGGGFAAVYRLDYGRRRPIYVAGANGHLVVFSDRAMAMDSTAYGKKMMRARFWQALFASNRTDSPLRGHFGLSHFKGKHTLIINADALSFHYRHFSPGIRALRFDFDGRRWTAYLRLAKHAADTFKTAALWQSLPAHPALCVGVPMDWQRLRPVFARMAKRQPAIQGGVVRALGKTAAVCWFDDGSIYTPLLLTSLSAGARWNVTLGAVFAASIGNSWPRYRDVDLALPAGATTVAGAAKVWAKRLPTDYGRYTLTLARGHGRLVFSPDSKAVRNTLAAASKLRPTLAGRLPTKHGPVIAVVTPAHLAALFTHAVEGGLPADQQPLFHSIASERLLPRLKAAAKYPAFALSLPGAPYDNAQPVWQPIAWHQLAAP